MKKKKHRKSEYIKIKKKDLKWYILLIITIGVFVGWLGMFIMIHFMIS